MCLVLFANKEMLTATANAVNTSSIGEKLLTGKTCDFIPILGKQKTWSEAFQEYSPVESGLCLFRVAFKYTYAITYHGHNDLKFR